MSITSVTIRRRVTDLDSAASFYQRLTGECVKRFEFAGAQLAAVGPFLLLCAPDDVAERLGRVGATIGVDDIEVAQHLLEDIGAEILAHPIPSPNGTRLIARHPDGGVFEYVGPASGLLRILLVCGSTRAASTNRAALATMNAAPPAGVITALFDDLRALPPFDPDEDFDPLPPAVLALRTSIAAADGILFCSPEYAGALPGSFKNLLDWTVGGGEMDGKPAAWISVAPAGRGESAYASLATILGYVGADVIPEACTQVTVPHDAVDRHGLVSDPLIAAELNAALAGFAQALSSRP